MTNATRNLVVAMAVGIAAVSTTREAEARGETVSPATPQAMRVRTPDPAIARLMQEATARSETFSGLVETINASDGFVYVEAGDCGHGVRACLVAVTATGTSRILRVRVDSRRADWDLMGSIGHELRHAVEVLGDSSVTNTTAMFHFYNRVGRRVSARAFETKAAVDAGNTVRAEVSRQATRAR